MTSYDDRPTEGICDHCEQSIWYAEDGDYDGEKFISCGMWVSAHEGLAVCPESPDDHHAVRL